MALHDVNDRTVCTEKSLVYRDIFCSLWNSNVDKLLKIRKKQPN